MYASRNFVRLVFCIFVTLAFSTAGQAATSATDIQNELEDLRRPLQEQRTEIEKLREELKAETDRRGAQQMLLVSLLAKLDSLVLPPANGGVTESDVSPPPLPKASDSPIAAPAKTVNRAIADHPQTKTANAVETGIGKVRFAGLLQGWYAAGNQGFNDTLRIRRAEMRFTGDILPQVKWSIMLDLAKALSLSTNTAAIGGTPVVRTVNVNQASRVFQEGYITLSYYKRANINIGQFKIPVSQEGLQSSAALDTVERALFLTDRSRGGGLGDVRELGIMAYGPLSKQVDYQIGIFNGVGESQNDVDQNDQKAVVGRLIFRPTFIKGLQIGGSGAFGNGTSTINPRRDRLGVELVYEHDKVRIKSELMTGVDGEIHRRGYYAHFGYRLRPKFEAIFRFDTFDPDIRRESGAANVTERDYIGGFNYFIKDNNYKLQFNYLRKTFTNGIIPSRNLFLVALQTAW